MPRWKQNQNKDRYKEGGKSAEEIFGLASGAIGAVSGLASFGMGIDSMITARAKQAEAERQNKLLMEEAKRMSEKDFYAGVNVPLDAFNKQFEETLQQQQQSLQALQEGDARSVAAGVGRVGALAGEQGEKTRIAMGDALYLNNKMKADSKQAVNQQGIDINVGAAQDQSQIARDANRQMNQSMTQAAEGLASGFQSAAGMIPGYLQGRTDSLTSDLIDQINSMELDGVSLNSKDQGDRDLFSNNDAFKKMKPKQIKDFIKQLKKNDPAAILNVKNIIKG
tara:strand:+ start:63 stop:902 length:840 start_codon:yes stop_codon:yes gene_type:complete